jgi:hypothetical protein
MGLKNNQKNLLEDVKDYFTDLENWRGTEWSEVDKNHGRIEKRICWSPDTDAYMNHHA